MLPDPLLLILALFIALMSAAIGFMTWYSWRREKHLNRSAVKAAAQAAGCERERIVW
jgi:hypothetical protein